MSRADMIQWAATLPLGSRGRQVLIEAIGESEVTKEQCRFCGSWANCSCTRAAPAIFAAVEAEMVRPIVGIENRTAQEVFDIMCDRLRFTIRSPTP